MKVLVVPSWYPPNGGRFFKLQAESLAKLGHKVDVLILEEKGITQKRNSKIDASKSKLVHEIRNTYYRIPKLNNLNIALFIKKYKMLLSNYLAENKPDIIHVHSAVWAGVVVAGIAKERNIPYIITEHRSLFLESKLDLSATQFLKVKNAFDSAGSVLAVSSIMKKSIEQITKSRVLRLPNMIDTDFFTLKKIAKEEKFTFISVGNLIDVKGYDLLITAFAGLSKNIPNIHLKIIGQGENLIQLKNQAKSLYVNVEFCSYKTKVELLLEYQAATAYVSSSRKETFGVAIIEAMSCGLPVVATKSGGPQDIVNDEVGYLAENENATSLQAKMQLMIENIGNFEAERIRKYVIANYSEKVVSLQLENELKKCLNNSKQ